jgi:hypothetical protein
MKTFGLGICAAAALALAPPGAAANLQSRPLAQQLTKLLAGTVSTPTAVAARRNDVLC